tara:strand:- start:83 stop:553 length:471 start_codon:yes stop_codon:yes gene_type:complete
MNNFSSIYNSLILLTRNKDLYTNLNDQDTFSDRLVIFFFHLGFFLKIYKSSESKAYFQKMFDFFIKQIELSIREIGYGDVSVNKMMKKYINLFYSILDNVEKWEIKSAQDKVDLFMDYLKIKENEVFYVEYFDKFCIFLSKNSLNTFTKDILKFNN